MRTLVKSLRDPLAIGAGWRLRLSYKKANDQRPIARAQQVVTNRLI